MRKNEIIYVCGECGNESQKWSGKCLSCGAWNSLREFKSRKTSAKSQRKGMIDRESEIVSLDKVKMTDFTRISTNIEEADRVFGGGIIPGSFLLLGGDPGIGKSTLMLRIASNIKNSIYVSGEESAQQIKSRAQRMDIDLEKINILIDTDIDQIISKIAAQKPKIVIIDSIQTMYDNNFPSTSGSLVQVRECALKLGQFAKENNIAIIIVGHVTKDGNVAGPRTLEHAVDAMLYLEGERHQQNRILRGVKNRFGSTDEIGVFEMINSGLVEVKNPSKLFLEQKENNISGSVVTAIIEGNRPILVEVQALVMRTNFGYPKRTISGFDLNRLSLILAILSQRAKINLSNFDVYVNIVGGLKTKDPGVDLAIAISLVSAFLNNPINNDICVFGELGLSGEIRKVKFSDKRTKEAKRLGFEKIFNEKYLTVLMRKIFKNIKK
jgi:DNA repair protein RadA/Sms